MNNTRYLNFLKELKDNPPPFEARTRNSTTLIIDGLNTFIRAYSSSPATNINGEHVGGISGFLLSIGYAIKTLQPTRVIMVFDGIDGSQRRRKIYSEYKSGSKPSIRLNRNEAVFEADKEKQNQIFQLMKVAAFIETLPVTFIQIDKIEADDTIAYITKNLLTADDKCYIMSADKDFLQLVNKKTKVWSPTKKKLYDVDNICEDYGIPAHNFLLYRTITGDKSDNVPGIKGVQLKTLIKLLPDIVTDKVIEIKDLPTINEFFVPHMDLLKRNYQLMQLTDVDISGSAKIQIINRFEQHTNVLNIFKFLSLLVELQMESTIKNVNVWLREVFTGLNQFTHSTT